MSVDPTQYPYPPQPPQPWIYQVPPPIASAPMHVHWPVPGGPGFVSSGGGASGVRIAFAAVGGFVLFMLIAAIVIPSFLNQRAKRAGASGQPEGTQIAIDGHASLPGGHAQMTFEPLP
ncbi:MAG: hypothetical protein HZB14_09715, partial [Actinobacteria bacterium]|nr:hypothetical protein [Actinomycetota bacterium]